jgi:hypothetical protein
VQNDWSSPSGSRWEPVPQPGSTDPSLGSPPGPVRPVPTVAPAAVPRRRHRRPLVAVLLTVLGAGAVTGGAAYVHDDGAGASPTPTSSHVTGSGDHGGRRDHGPHGSSS